MTEKIEAPHFNTPPQLLLCQKPTPIQFLSRISKEVGKNIFVKRDDDTGFIHSGNKVRKLEFLLADALEKGADSIVTCGGIQSNHCRATAALSTRLRLRPILLLRGEEQEFQPPFTGNLFFNKMLSSDIRMISAENWSKRYEILKEICEQYEENSWNPYLIPEGGSNGLGSFGYLKCVEEILKQINENEALPNKFDSVFCASGSGGTYSGLLLGKYLFDLMETDFYTVNVCDSRGHFEKIVMEILTDAIRNHQLPISFILEDIRVIDGYVGEGYAKADDQMLKFILRVAREEGLFLDPVYTGKAFWGMMESIKKVPEAFGENVLFIHTGGTFGNYAFSNRFSNLILEQENKWWR